MHRRDVMRAAGGLGLGALAGRAWGHHGWSSFDQARPIYLHGQAERVQWRNPHAELVLALSQPLQLPADLAQRPLPAQTAPVDGPDLLRRATLPTRRDSRWQVELAPMFRLSQWQVPEIRPGTELAVVGFTFVAERGEALLRVEYLFLNGQAYGMRSGPA
jgi:hypothetical protein